MANVINRITKQYLKSVNTPDYPESEWIINPILPKCDPEEWIIEGDLVRETTQIEKDAKEIKRLAEEAEKIEKQNQKEMQEKIEQSQKKDQFIALSAEDKLIYLYDRGM